MWCKIIKSFLFFNKKCELFMSLVEKSRNFAVINNSKSPNSDIMKVLCNVNPKCQNGREGRGRQIKYNLMI